MLLQQAEYCFQQQRQDIIEAIEAIIIILGMCHGLSTCGGTWLSCSQSIVEIKHTVMYAL